MYAVTTVTLGRETHFKEAGNATAVVDALRFVESTRRTTSLAWVVMPDHVHWLFQLRSGTLASCLQMFKSRSARLINQRLGRQQPLWQPGYFDHAVRGEACLRRHALYIAANPVRAGLAAVLGGYPHAWCRWPLRD